MHWTSIDVVFHCRRRLAFHRSVVDIHFIPDLARYKNRYSVCLSVSHLVVQLTGVSSAVLMTRAVQYNAKASRCANWVWADRFQLVVAMRRPVVTGAALAIFTSHLHCRPDGQKKCKFRNRVTESDGIPESSLMCINRSHSFGQIPFNRSPTRLFRQVQNARRRYFLGRNAIKPEMGKRL